MSSNSFRVALRSTAILASGSVVSVVAGLAAAKVQAVLLGPAGVGYIGLLQSLIGLSALVAGLGISTGLIRIGATALAQNDLVSVASLRRASWFLLAIISCISMLILVGARVPISRAMLGGREHASVVPLMGIVLIFTLASTIQTGLLNVYQRVRALARSSIMGTLLGLAASLSILTIWRERGIAFAILTTTTTLWFASWLHLRREVPPIAIPIPHDAMLNSARKLLRFGVPYTISTLVGAGVQLVLPVLILQVLGRDDVGYFRAATTIAISYLGFLLTAMGQDYYPRLAAVNHQPQVLAQLVNNQLRLVFLLATPIILVALALTPILVPVIYTPQFTPAVDILEWQLVGDIFKLSSWTMGFVILARSSSQIYFFTEVIAGIATLAFAWLGMRAFGSAGLGLAILGTYIVHWAVVGMVVRHETGLIWTSSNRLFFTIALLAAGTIRALPWLGLGAVRTPIALALAVMIGCASLYLINTELGGIRALLARKVDHA